MEKCSCELAQVVDEHILIDSRGNPCCYVTRNGAPLRPGFYLVLQPEGWPTAAFDRRARYIGPVGNRQLAAQLKTTAVAWGLIEPARGTESPPSGSREAVEEPVRVDITHRTALPAPASGARPQLRTVTQLRRSAGSVGARRMPIAYYLQGD